MVTGFRRFYRNFGKLLAQEIQAGMPGQNSAALVTPTEVRSHSTELQDFVAPLQKSVGINLKNKNERSLAFIASLTRTNATSLNRVSSINYTGQRSNPRIT